MDADACPPVSWASLWLCAADGSYNCPCHLGPSVPVRHPPPPLPTPVAALPPHPVVTMSLVQSFVGSHYYCESGNSGPSWQARWYAEDILWDGSDCPHSDNHCCSSAAEPEEGMPWFRRSFDDATIAITVGLCSDQGRSNEDVGLVEMEMCVRVSRAHAHARPCGGGLFADGVVRCDNGAACAQVGQGRRRTVAGAAVRVVRGWQVRYCRGKGGRELPEVCARVARAQPVFCSLAPVDSVPLLLMFVVVGVTPDASQGSKSAADCVSCPAGHYCEARSAAPTPCPAGKYVLAVPDPL